MALSSAEAELYACSRVGTEIIGLRNLLRGIGERIITEIFLDSSAALSLCEREGLGLAKHIDIQYLWLQERIKAGDLHLKNIFGS